jgi:hypothetical protein
MNRGDRKEEIFHDDPDRQRFLETLGEACQKTGWHVHAYCPMGSLFHLVAETPQANLVAGRKWSLGTYTGRFNRRLKLCGHLFVGRYKSLTSVVAVSCARPAIRCIWIPRAAFCFISGSCVVRAN